MAKLYEIENYLEKKVRRKNWGKELTYIYFKNGAWVNRDGYFFMGASSEEDNWEEYTEPEAPKVRRLWRWIINSQDVFSPDGYFDDHGIMSTCSGQFASVSYKNWDEIHKIKRENEWIEVNEKGEIINWSGKE